MKTKKIATALFTMAFGFGVVGSSLAINHDCSSTYSTCMNGGGNSGQCYAAFLECIESGN
ncbi:hypothetical protein [Thalassomonas haliotis]|uniref:Transmembrane protein n=1 Tax=Thalassomonas haliotis TaxID=485448 RepID=A0ABY7V9A6_9GAMM|nr:hypothetical protein [Thalassomonas haliotis]WDE10184.1 hypothetical protein H3N35_18120 [Thalassomonas haliotis]